jgi:hypothetical protein
MWIVEINFAGHRFTHEVHGPRRPIYRISPRNIGWRLSQLRQTRAA